MEKKPLIAKKSRRFCCCFTSEDSDNDSSINLPRVESDISPSILEPEIYTTKKFAADRIYFLGNSVHKYLVIFRHLLVESGDEPGTATERPESVSEDLWKERYRLFSRFDEGVEICGSAWTSEVYEKIAKCLVKTLIDRSPLETCVVSACGAGSLPIQFAKNARVVALDEDPVKLECLQRNSEVYEVSSNIVTMQGTIFEYFSETKPDLVVLRPECKVYKGQALILSEQVPNLIEMVMKSFGLADSLMIILPPTLDIFDFIQKIESIDLDPWLEIFLIFDNNHLKNIACLMGKMVKLSTVDVVSSIMSKLGLNGRQKEFIFAAIEQISLKRVLNILDEVEHELQTGSVLDRIKSKAKRFFEIIREEDRVLLANLILLYKGEKGDDVVRNLEEMNLYFVEIDTVGPSILEMSGRKFVGFDEILHFLEEYKIKETPNKNSLFLLMDS